jgi:hypothetical protein
MNTFRQIFLPYALMKLRDGWFLPVNRKYKPLGYPDRGIDYDAATSKVRIKGLTDARAERIGLKVTTFSYYLYCDHTNPERSAANWRRYQGILMKLMKLMVDHEEKPELWPVPLHMLIYPDIPTKL